MEQNKNFLEYYESEKVKNWENSYINYKKLIEELSNLFITKQSESQQVNEDILESNNLDNIDITTNETNNEKEKKDSITKEKVKSFFKSLDQEVKKIYIFYSSKEKDIYQSLNKKIKNKSKINDKSCDEILKAMDELDYLCQLCAQIVIFIHLNIQALKSILSILEDTLNIEDFSISYNYIKKFLSKNNSDLIYILSFKTLEESIISIQGIFDENIKTLKNKDEYKKNNKIKSEYKKFKNNIKKNISKFDEIHEKIFSELTQWKKYLDVNLDLPSSSRNSIFRETSFVGDMFNKKRKVMPLSIEDNKNEDDIISPGLVTIKSLDRESAADLKSDLSNIFNQEDDISEISKKLLSKENSFNLKMFYILVFFYNYSYFVIIPKILYILENKLNEDGSKYKKFYGLIISFPSLGSLISKYYLIYLIKYNFKLTLIRSLFYLFSHYALFVLGIELENIFLLFMGRFLLGLSSLDRLCKIYIDQCIPSTKHSKTSRNYLTSIYLGYIIGLIASDIEIIIIALLSEKRKDYKTYEEYKEENPSNEYEFLYTINGILFFIISIIVIFNFKNPNDKQFKIINESIIDFYKENRLTTNFIDKDEKEAVENQQDLFKKANDLSELSGENELRNYSNEIERKNINHFYKVFFLLVLFLITSQYTSENNLMILPRLFELDKNYKSHYYGGDDNDIYNYNIKDDYYYISYFGYIFTSLIYLISLLVQKYFLSKIYYKKSSQKTLLILFGLPIINLFASFWPYFKSDYDSENGSIKSFLPVLGNSLMIFDSEFLILVTVNLFIGLLPIDVKICCFKSSTLINIIVKLFRLFPGLIYFILEYFDDSSQRLRHLYSLGFELFLFIVSFLFCLFKGNHLLKSYSITRILYLKN